MIDDRLVQLSLILKNWNKVMFPEKQQRVNSYSLVLMCIAYLQHEGILPRLQNIHTQEPKSIEYFKSVYKKRGNVNLLLHESWYLTDVAFERDLPKAKSHLIKSKELSELSIAELLIGFFHFYTNVFDPDVHVISTSHKEGSLISK